MAPRITWQLVTQEKCVCGVLFSGERQNGVCFAGHGAVELSGSSSAIFGSGAHLKIIVLGLADAL
jgi:hypothetical protein